MGQEYWDHLWAEAQATQDYLRQYAKHRGPEKGPHPDDVPPGGELRPGRSLDAAPASFLTDGKEQNASD